MTLSTLLQGPGVRGLVVANNRGDLVSELGTSNHAESVAATIGVLAREFGNAGQLLGLGTFCVATIRTPQKTGILAQQSEMVMNLDLDPDQPTGALEGVLVDSDWAATLAWGITDLSEELDIEVEVVSGSEPQPEEEGSPPISPVLPIEVPRDARILDDSWDVEQVLAPMSDPPATGTSSSTAVEIRLGGIASTAARTPSGVVPLSSANEPSNLGRSGHDTFGSVFSGSLGLLPFADLLELLRSGRRSGTLVCAADAAVVTIELRSGGIVASSSPAVLGIGDWLKQRGVLSDANLEQALSLQNQVEPRSRLGTLLVQHGHVEPNIVREAICAQIVSVVRELMEWKDGQFAFDPEAATDVLHSEIAVELDPQSILLRISNEFEFAQR